MSKRLDKRMALYGIHSVYTRLLYNPSTIEKICLREGFSHPHIERMAKEKSLPTQYYDRHAFEKIRKGAHTQGVLAYTVPFLYSELKQVGSGSVPSRTLFFLDRIYDPQNVGALMRTVSCFGECAVVLARHDSCEVTEAVLHVANGAENFVPVVRVNNLRRAIEEAKEYGYWITGAVAHGGEDIRSFLFPGKTAVVLGSEGSGIRHGIAKALDYKVTIPMRGAALSFNVAVAGGIICYEVSRQEKKESGKKAG